MAPALLFDELIDRLRRDGFAVGTDQYVRMHELLVHAEAVSPEELKTRICPIFAMSADEQQRFHIAYDDYFAAHHLSHTRSLTVSQRIARTARSGIHPKPTMEIPHPTPARHRWKLAAVMAAVVLAVLAGLYFQPEPEPDLAPMTPPIATRPEVVSKDVERALSMSDFAQQNLALLLLTGLGITLLAFEIIRSAVRSSRQRAHRGQGRPFDWPLRDPSPNVARLFADGRFFRASRLLKGRETADVLRLDISRTIASTIRALGDPIFEYTSDRRATEYLFLIEHLSERDHLSAYVHAMVDALARDGVLVEVYEHDGDPRLCWKPGSGIRIPVTDLHPRFPQHRLILIGHATALTNPVTGEPLDSIPRLFPWRWRALLTPDAESVAVRRFGEYFDVYGIANNGLTRLAERWQHDDGRARPVDQRRTARRPEPPELAPSAAALETALPPLLFAWLLRCSVHPTLHWDLTRALAPQMSAIELDATLLDLARLTWFRQGRLPEPLRLELVARLALDEEEESAARATVLRILAAAPPPPEGSVAERVFQIEQIGHRLWSAREEPSAVRPLIRQLRHFPLSHIARDGALIMLLREAPGTLFMHVLPQAVRRFVFRQGIPAFGAHSFLGLLIVIPVLVYAGSGLAGASKTTTVQVSETVYVPNTIAPTTAPPAEVTVVEPPPPAPQIAQTTETQPPVTETTTYDVASTATTPQVVAPTDTAPPVPPVVAPLAALPKLLQPNDEIYELREVSDRIAFSWEPEGKYVLMIFDASTGRQVLAQNVSGSSWKWKPAHAGSRYTWTLTTPDGRATAPLPFQLQYEIQFDPNTMYLRYPAVEDTLPTSCKPDNGRRELDLRLRTGETVESVEMMVLDKGKLDVVDAKIVEQRGSLVVYEYRFHPGKGCAEDYARIRVSAKVKGKK